MCWRQKSELLISEAKKGHRKDCSTYNEAVQIIDIYSYLHFVLDIHQT